MASHVPAKLGFAIVTVLGLAATSAGADPGPPPVIEACQGRLTGALRIATGGGCTRFEVPIQWNVQGPAGAPGPAGPAGPEGPPGGSGGGGGGEPIVVEEVVPNPTPEEVLYAEPGAFELLGSCDVRSGGSLGVSIRNLTDQPLLAHPTFGFATAPGDVAPLLGQFGGTELAVVGLRDAEGDLVTRELFVSGTLTASDECSYVIEVEPA